MPKDETTPEPSRSEAVDAPTAERTPPPPAAEERPTRSEEPVAPKRRRFLRRRKKRPPKSLGARIVSGVAEIPLLVLAAFLIAVVIKTFIMQAFYIPSGSMRPTLEVGDRVLVEKVSGLFGGPGRGSVVVFARHVFTGVQRPDLPWYEDVRDYIRELLGLPTGREEDYIKRVVAVGGDTVRYEGTPRELIVNGEKVEEDYLKSPDNSSQHILPNDCPPKMESSEGGCLVPAGTVFVMGDNRNNSADSRAIGPVDEDKIVGKAFVVIWPPSNLGGL